jgi:hypothetical protein
MTLKSVSANGFLKDVNDNFADLGAIGSVNGLGTLRVARFTFDGAGNDSAGVSNLTAAAHPTGVTLPIHAIVVGGFLDVNTALTSTNSTATVAVKVEAANDIQTAAAVSGAPFSTIGRKAITPKANTPESTSVKCTAAREITVTVAVEALLAGKFTGYLYYVEGIASA